MSVLDWKYQLEVSNGDVYEIPVSAIATHRATHYAHEFNNDIRVSLDEDTIPLFKSDLYEIEDWAKNNMNWVDVVKHAKRVKVAYNLVNFQQSWVNGKVEIVKE